MHSTHIVFYIMSTTAFVFVVDRPEDVIHIYIHTDSYIDIKEIRSLVRGTLVMSTDRSFLEPQKLLRRISVLDSGALFNRAGGRMTWGPLYWGPTPTNIYFSYKL